MAALSKTQRRKRRLGIVGDVYAILIYTVLYIPVAVMMVFSFNDQKYNFYWNGFTTEWYGKLLENDALIGSLWYSLIIAVLATVISVVIAFFCTLGQSAGSWKSFGIYIGIGALLWLWMVCVNWKKKKVTIETVAGTKEY